MNHRALRGAARHVGIFVMDRCRKRADSAVKYTLYFELLAQKFKQYKVEPRQVYNMDEKGVLIKVLNKIKRIFNKKNTKMVCTH